MRNLLFSAFALLTLSIGSANAQISQTEAMDRLSGGNVIGYRVIEQDCPIISCGGSNLSTIDQASEFLADAIRDSGDRFTIRDEPRSIFDVSDSILRRFPQQQTVFLNFDAGGAPTFPVDIIFFDGTTATLFLEDFVYTPAIRDAIQDLLEADYERFNYGFVQSEPGGDRFTTLNIGDNDRAPGSANITLTEVAPGSFGFSILFGMADEIDFGNLNRASAAFVDASFWVVLAELFGPGALSGLSGIPISDPTDQAEIDSVVELAVINQSANTSAHELGHTVGLRHHDSFGAPGDGLPTTGTPGPGDFSPIFPGGTDGAETVLHTMASGASVGLPIQNSTAVDRFFSERSAIKLRINERGFFFTESFLNGNPDGDGDRVRLIPMRPTNIPNTIVEGENSGSRFIRASQAVVEGRISEEGEIDVFKFKGTAGEFLNLEQISFTNGTLLDSLFFTELRVFKIEDDGSRTLAVSNFLPAESIDPLIVDWQIPETATYELEVEAIDVGFAPEDFGLPPLPAPLNVGNYSVHIYMVDGPLGNGNQGFTRDQMADLDNPDRDGDGDGNGDRGGDGDRDGDRN